MKKIIGFILAISMLLSFAAILSACAKKNNNNNGNVDVGDDDYYKKFDGVNFDGQLIRFVVADSSKDPQCLAARAVEVDEKSGDAVDDLLFDRNRKIESKLGVDIEVTMMTSHTSFTADIQKFLDSGADELDVFMGQQANDIDLCLDGNVIDFNTIPAESNYIDLDGDWWATNYMSLFEYGNARYWLCGGYDITYTGGAGCVFVNKRLYDQYCENDYGEIYEFVKSGAWDLNAFAEMSKHVYVDKNSNDKIDDGDQFGYFYGYNSSSWHMMSLVISIGVEMTSRTDDGKVEWIFTDKNKANINALETLYNILNDTPGMKMDRNNAATKKDQDYFKDCVQLFAVSEICALSGLREMQDDFYLIPLPKLDAEKQENYRCSISDGVHLIGIPYWVPEERYAAITATLDFMSYESHKDINPIYFNEVLKYKYAREEGLAEMVQLCHDCAFTDFGLIWERYIFDEHWARYNGVCKNPTSQITKKLNKWTKTFDETIDKLDHPVKK